MTAMGAGKRAREPPLVYVCTMELFANGDGREACFEVFATCDSTAAAEAACKEKATSMCSESEDAELQDHPYPFTIMDMNHGVINAKLSYSSHELKSRSDYPPPSESGALEVP